MQTMDSRPDFHKWLQIDFIYTLMIFHHSENA